MTGLLCILAAALLLYAALHDLAARTVPNWLPMALLAVGLPLRLLDHSLLPGLLVALGTFVVLFSAWLAGAMGGGDVKLWAAATVLVPPLLPRELAFFLAVLVGGGLLAIIYLLLGALAPKPAASRRRAARSGSRLARIARAERWRIGRRAPLPYACAIAAGALLTLLPPSFQS